MAVTSDMPLTQIMEMDERLGEAEMQYLFGFFQHLGLLHVRDLQDIEVFEPVAPFLRSGLDEYELKKPLPGSFAAGALRAALGRIVRLVALQSSDEAPRRMGSHGYAAGVGRPPLPGMVLPPEQAQLPSRVTTLRGRQQPQQQSQQMYQTRSEPATPERPTSSKIGTPDTRSPFDRKLTIPLGNETPRRGGCGHSPPMSPRSLKLQHQGSCGGGSSSSIGAMTPSCSTRGSFNRAGSNCGRSGRETTFSKIVNGEGAPGPVLDLYRPALTTKDPCRRSNSPHGIFGTAPRLSPFGGVIGPLVRSPRTEYGSRGSIHGVHERRAYAARDQAAYMQGRLG